MRIPEQGLAADEVLSRLESYRAHDVTWRDGRTFAYVYDAGVEIEALCKKAYVSYLSDNALDPTAFPSLLRLENEVVAMMASHLNAGEAAVGSFTSGGTESIFLAVKTARDRFRSMHPGATRVEMVLPDTAHAAFEKAAYYLDVVPVRVPVDGQSFQADVPAMAAAVNEFTALLVGSATGYAHGVVDDITALGQLALKHDLLLHVDGCIGGFLLPYFKRLGGVVPDFDFRVPGVTSMSVDLHKYGFAAKGASVVLYKDPSLRRFQIYACSTWSGYTIVNPTVQSTRSGGPMAGAWAVMHAIGDDGYLALARRMFDATRRILSGIREIEGLKVLGEPHMNLVAVAGEGLGIFHVADEMKARGWFIQAQLGYRGSPANFHLSINPKSEQWVDAFLADLRDSVEAARKLPTGDSAEMVSQMFSGIDASTLTPEMFQSLLQVAGIGGVSLPDRMAGINEMLDALPAKLREKLLVEYVNQLYKI